ncbi:hypothetical protein [Streptomyces sp. NPDC101249]|uniref:hypothetical protein n=1 Tax=Streptomyces sp. NPDC101249 TaxID=3366140 RepID=UPI0037F85D1E
MDDPTLPTWAQPATEEQKLAAMRRIAKALTAPPVAPPGWATTTDWPTRHKRPGDRRVHATAGFTVGGVRQIWTACEERIGQGGYALNHMPIDCRDCRRALQQVAAPETEA